MTAFAAAGWLLAEVALILMVIFQGAQDPGEATPNGSDSISPSPKPTNCPPPGVQSTFDRIGGIVLDGPNDRSAARKLVARIKATANHRPGIILVFGVSYSASSPSSGTRVAEDLIDMVRDMSFYDRWKPAMRPFLQIYGPGFQTGEVFADVYYYERERC